MATREELLKMGFQIDEPASASSGGDTMTKDQLLGEGFIEDDPTGTTEPKVEPPPSSDKNLTDQQKEQMSVGVRKLAEETGLGEAAIVSIGKGYMNAYLGSKEVYARAIGDDEMIGRVQKDREENERIFGPLREEHPVTTFAGELAGEAAPFAPFGAVASAGKSLASRAALSGLTGAMETGVVSGGDTEATLMGGGAGAGMSAGIDIVAPRVGKVIKKVTSKVDPAQIRRTAAGEFGVELSEAQAGKKLAAQEAEDLVLGSPTPAGEAGRRIEGKRLEQAATGAREKLLRPLRSSIDLDFEKKASNFSQTEFGNILKASIDDIKLRDEKIIDDLYEVAKELPGYGVDLNKKEMKDLFEVAIDEIEPEEKILKSVKKTLAKYGVLGENPVKKGNHTIVTHEGEKIAFLGDIEDFDLNNSEEVRKRLNKAFKGDNTGLVSVLKKQLDKNVGDEVELSLQRTKVGDEKIEAFSKARSTFKKYKETYAASDIIQNLISNRRGTKTPSVSSEEVFNKIFRSSRKVDNVKRIKRVLLNSPTEASKQTYRDMQAVAVEYLLKDAVDAKGALSGAKLNSAIGRMGEDTLKELLDKDSYKMLKKFQGVLGDLTIPLDKHKFTSSDNRVLNAFIRLASVKALGFGKHFIASDIIEHSVSKKAASKNLKRGLESLQGIKGEGRVTRLSKTAARTLTTLAGAGAAAKKEENTNE